VSLCVFRAPLSVVLFYQKADIIQKKLCRYFIYKKESIPFLPKIIAHRENMVQAVFLSSAIVSNLALGNDLRTACYLAKDYIETYLQSNPTKLGYHHV
jgi:hydroxymethylpyrimidine/phosphomethylpyrimidine kinase